ncbi:unnamed protein product [Sphacelaria rigidula]
MFVFRVGFLFRDGFRHLGIERSETRVRLLSLRSDVYLTSCPRHVVTIFFRFGVEHSVKCLRTVLLEISKADLTHTRTDNDSLDHRVPLPALPAHLTHKPWYSAF